MSTQELILQEISTMSDEQLTEILQFIKDTKKENTENWYNLSMQELNEAYGENEPEYTVEHIKEFNPNYEGSSTGF